jgi:hypothetical protein
VQDIVGSPGRLPDVERERIYRRFREHFAERADARCNAELHELRHATARMIVEADKIIRGTGVELANEDFADALEGATGDCRGLIGSRFLIAAGYEKRAEPRTNEPDARARPRFIEGQWVRVLRHRNVHESWHDAVGEVTEFGEYDSVFVCRIDDGSMSHFDSTKLESWVPRIGERVRVTRNGGGCEGIEGPVEHVNPDGTFGVVLGNFGIDELEPAPSVVSQEAAAPSELRPCPISADRLAKWRERGQWDAYEQHRDEMLAWLHDAREHDAWRIEALEKQAAELMMTRDTFFSFREIKNRQGCEFHERLTALEQRLAAVEKKAWVAASPDAEPRGQ